MNMKRKRTSLSALKSSSSQQTVTSYNLPDKCWESIFRFIIDTDDYNINNNRYYLNSLSLVSKQFLSITNRLLSSFTIHQSFLQQSTETELHGLFKRFTNLNSLNLRSIYFKINLGTLLIKISCFPLKLTSLNISCQHTIPANGLRAFSQKITTLTSLTCSRIHSLSTSDLFLIAECFPLLQELDLSYPLGCKNYDHSSYVEGVEALSLALIKLRKINLSRFPINDLSLFHLFHNCKHLEEVIMFTCDQITDAGIASALRERPTLRSLWFSSVNPDDGIVFSTSQSINSLVSLKGLTSLALPYMLISDELLYSIAKEGLRLIRLDLHCCIHFSKNGIFRLLSKCQRIKYLDLQDAYFLKDQHVGQLSSFLCDLVSINLSCCPKLTQSALFTLARNCPALSEIKMENIMGKFVGNSNSLVEFGVYPQLKSLYLGDNTWLSDKSIIMFASNFPNLQQLHLKNCNSISDGICQVLRRCGKIRHLNIAGCLNVNLLGLDFVVPKLEVLNLSDTNVDDETLYVISKNCCGLLQLLLENCYGVTEKGVKHVEEKCTKLSKIVVKSDLHLSDNNRKLLLRHGSHIDHR